MFDPRRAIKSSTQEAVEIVDIVNGVVVLKDGSAAIVLETNAINFDLLSEKEQEAMTFAYGQLLNSLSFPLQIVVRSKRKDISAYLTLLKDEEGKQKNTQMVEQIRRYRSFIETTVTKTNVLEKKFYLALPYTDPGASAKQFMPIGRKKIAFDTKKLAEKSATILNPRRDHLTRLLARLSLQAHQLTNEELTKLFFYVYNPGAVMETPLGCNGQHPKGETRGMSLSSSQIPDLIAPSMLEVDFTYLKTENKFFRTLFMASSTYPRIVQPNWLSPLINFDHALDVSMFIYPHESKDTLDNLKRRIAEMEATIETQVKTGQVIDPMVQVQLDDAMKLQEELARGSERFFNFSLYLTISADSLEELEQVTKQVQATLGALMLAAKIPALQMEEAFKSTLPLGSDKLMITRNMNTSCLADTFPFTSSELTANEGVLYGLNKHNDSLIIFDRFTLENANSVFFAKAGAGKSYAVKLEIARSLMFGTEIIVIDPENEYINLARAYGGQYLSFGFNSSHKINPFDLAGWRSEEENVLGEKVASLHSLMRVIMGNLNPTEDAILDRALILTYKMKGITADPATQTKEPPLVEDLYKVLIGMEETTSQGLADRLERFVKGSLTGIFDQQSTIDIKNPFTVFSIRDVQDNLRPVAMYIILDFIWNRIRKDMKKRLLVVDEAWYLMKYPDSAQFLYGIAKRARKYYLGVTTITQDVEDFLASEYGKAIITNSSMQVLLKQSTVAMEKLADIFNLSEGEKNLLMSAEIGEGLFFAGQSHVHLQVLSSPDEHRLVTSKPSEVLRYNAEDKKRI